MEAHNSRSVFVKHARDIGKAYRSQAIELISICLIFSQVAPQFANEDAELRRVLRVCDLALHSAADSGQKVTDKANKRFENATRVVCRYFIGLCLSAGMTILPQKGLYTARLSFGDFVFPIGPSPLQISEDKWRKPKMMIKFVLLRSPLAALHDPETVIVHQMLSAKPSLSEILWNFSRYEDRARITLQQNPHFYSSLPADESAYTSTFKLYPLRDLGTALKSHGTVYVLIDRPGRVFIETGGERRGFGNVWMLNDTLIFKDGSGVLEGEQLVRNSNINSHWWCDEEPVVFPNCECCTRLNHSLLPPIITAPSVSSTPRGPFDDWTVLSHPPPHPINLQIYSAQSRCRSTMDLDLPPPPPTSREPRYQVLYTSINTLNDDVLLSIFKHYQPDDESHGELRLWWSKLAHVCRRWRRLIFESPFYLDAHIQCTEGAPVVGMLSFLPPLPLVVNYKTRNIRALDELGISHALRLRNRVRRIDLRLPPSSLRKLLVLIDEPFQILERLYLASTIDQDTGLILPKTLLAPNLRHLSLLGIKLSNELPLLSSAVSLVTLTLENIRDSAYLLPEQLIPRLRAFRQLEELSICFAIPLPHSGAEREFLDAIESPTTLPRLKRLTFRGVSSYLESLVAQIRAPSLERLHVTLFDQAVFVLPHLSYFTNATEGLQLPILANISFEHGGVTLTTDHRQRLQFWNRSTGFNLRVMCDVFDRHVDCAAQICNTLRPVLSGVEKLTLTGRWWMPVDRHDGDFDSATWRRLLRPFVGVKKLHMCRVLQSEISRALQVDDAGLDPWLLPSLQELIPDISEWYLDNSFASFIDARQIAGRPVRLVHSPEPLPWPSPQLTAPFSTDFLSIPERHPFEHYYLPPYSQSPLAYTPMLWPWEGQEIWHAPLENNLPAPHVPPRRVEHDPPRSSRTTRSVRTQPPPPDHIRSRLRPSQRAGSTPWR